MTIEDKIKEMLVEHGMFENDATAVVGMMKADEVHESMAHRWNDDIEDYDANCPEAWYRPMFVQPVADGRGR